VSIFVPPGGDSSTHIEQIRGFLREGRKPSLRAAKRPIPPNGALHI
jgi:hypothetical protein